MLACKYRRLLLSREAATTYKMHKCHTCICTQCFLRSAQLPVWSDLMSDCSVNVR